MRLLRLAALLALLALLLICWASIDGRPLPLIIGLTVGQGVGTLSFLLYLAVIVADLRRAKVLAAPADAPTAEPATPVAVAADGAVDAEAPAP